jgi:thioredoxin 1
MRTVIMVPTERTDIIMPVTLKEFFADWAGQRQKSTTQILDARYENVNFDRINVDEQMETANEYQVRTVPTIIIENDGEIIDRFVDVTSADTLEDSLERALSEATRDSGAKSQPGESSGDSSSGDTVVFEGSDSSARRETKVFDPAEDEDQPQ